MHKIIIIGNLGRDPEMRYIPSGESVTSFSVASNRRYRTPDGEQRDETTWFNMSAWGRQAEICNQYLTRGSQVYIEGIPSTRIYQGNDGQPRVSFDVRVLNMQMLSGRDSGMGEGQGRAPYGGGDETDEYGGGDSGNFGGGRSGGGGYGGRSSGSGYGGRGGYDTPNDDIDDLPF